MPTRRKGRDFSEPSLNEMLDDPVVQVVMARDGVKRREIVALMNRVQTRQSDSPAPPTIEAVPGE